MKKSRFFTILILFYIILLLIFYERSATALLNGLILWYKNVVPSLLPFFFLTRLLKVNDGIYFLSNKLSKVMNKLFCAPPISSYVLLSSVFSGYPVGAKLTADAYEEGIIDSFGASATVSFASTSGIIFTLGTVGQGMFKSIKSGLCIFISMLLAAIISGLIFRNKNATPNNMLHIKQQKVDNVLQEAAYSSVKSILIVGLYIALFSTFADLLTPVIGFVTKNEYVKASILGLIECTTGCNALSELSKNALSVSLSAGLIAFGGAAICFQCIAFLSKTKIRVGKYLLAKIVQGCLAVPICYLLLYL